MIPRYWPVIDLAARTASLSAKNVDAAASAFAQGLGIGDAAAVLPVPSARAGLGAFFSALALRDRRRVVVMSAQICPIVPRVLLRCGYRPVFVDTSPGVPSAGLDETMQGSAAAGGAQHVAAVIVAPMYGHVPGDIDGLAAKLDDTSVVIDMAQGILLADAMPALMRRADAIVYSFGVGKGLDTAGALIALRRGADQLRPLGQWHAFSWLIDVPRILALRVAVGLGVYRHLLGVMERELEAEKAGVPAVIDARYPVLPRGVLATWNARLTKLRGEIALARRRAGALFARGAIAGRCRDAAIYGAPIAVHLRQIIRLRDASRRDPVLALLRRNGVDAMPAGELLPGEYLADAAGEFPQARQFLSDAIRLPFLGRLSDASFHRVATVVESALDQRLS